MNLPALNCFSKVFLTASLVTLTAWITTGAEQSQARSNDSSKDLANGIYLYGQVEQPNQISKGYVVFQNIDGQVVGAFYYPRSEFQCFQGNLDDRTLDIQTLSTESTQVDRSTAELSNFHRIPVSDNDRRILSMCQQEAQTTANSSR
ncbi:hypothetical protein LEP3755_59730 [Leptolyngbya sp. NIES-3755]|nr:hypothetical protein LEP3755_59730 [Leptolyngbya sp. NIES-3755]